MKNAFQLIFVVAVLNCFSFGHALAQRTVQPNAKGQERAPFKNAQVEVHKTVEDVELKAWILNQSRSMNLRATIARFTRDAPAESASAWLLYPVKDKAAAVDIATAVVESLNKEHARIQVITENRSETITINFKAQTVIRTH